MAEPAGETALCVDFGSTYTKALLVDLDTAEVLAAAEHRTTIDTDVMEGYDACRAALVAADPRAAAAEVLACSSAGGGLRIAVVGNEELVTAEAGRRVALSSGGRVVSVHAAADATPTRSTRSTGSGGPALGIDDADLVLLTGGTDGGNTEVIVGAARDLVASGWRGPVVVAGNVDADQEVAAVLAGRCLVVLAENIVPRIGVLEPASARAAIRAAFLHHVIGGKQLSSRGTAFTDLVRGATPDVVLTGVEVLAGLVGEVVVVDVGGATTDVHSVVELDPDTTLTTDGLARDVVAPTPVTRTVEGDLGMRWSAVSTAAEAGLDRLAAAAERRRADPGFLPGTAAERDEDEALARGAVSLAVRRHCGRSRVVVSPEGRVVERTGVDLREVALVVGSGGVLRHGRPGVAQRVLAPALAEDADWQLPARARVVVDEHYLLAAIGLLAEDHPAASRRLASRLARTS